MMMLRATQPIVVREHAAGERDAHGNEVDGYRDTETQYAYSVAPSTTDEPGANRQLVASDLTVLAPAGFRVSPHDLVIWQGEEFEVVGELEDWSFGPFGFVPGVAFRLRRTEG